MADDAPDELDDVLAADSETPKSADKAKTKKKKAAADPNAPHLVLRLLLGAAGLMLVVGFFLPWIRLDAVNPQQAAQASGDTVAFVSGLEIAVGGDTLITTATGATPWAVLFLIPLFGAALAAVGFLGNRWSGVIGAVLGLVIVLYGLVTVVMLFFRTTSYGLWVVLGGAFLAVAGGTIAWARRRSAPPSKPAKS
ncbi:MAG: hypothetical protein AB8I08_00915 [Sandaracinaceae bacterium]